MSGHVDRQTDGSRATRVEKMGNRGGQKGGGRLAGNTWEQRENSVVVSSPSICSPHLAQQEMVADDEVSCC